MTRHALSTETRVFRVLSKEMCMAVTALDPKTALVVIDLQKGLAGLPTVHPFARIVAQAGALAELLSAS